MTHLELKKETISELSSPETVNGGDGMTISWVRWQNGIQIVNGRPVIP